MYLNLEDPVVVCISQIKGSFPGGSKNRILTCSDSRRDQQSVARRCPHPFASVQPMPWMRLVALVHAPSVPARYQGHAGAGSLAGSQDGGSPLSTRCHRRRRIHPRGHRRLALLGRARLLLLNQPGFATRGEGHG